MSKIFSNKLVYLLGLLPLFLMLISISSCRKDIAIVKAAQNYPGDTYPNLFEAFWNGMNCNYVYWDIDTTNWDKVYSTYKPLFAQLTDFSSSNEQLAEQYFGQMTAGLIDSHYNLTFEVTGNTFNPYINRKLSINPGYFSDSSTPTAALDLLIPNKYIDASTLKMGTDAITLDGAQTSLKAVSGTINNNILYLYFNHFAFSKAGANTTPVFNYFFNAIHNLPANIKGVVIDLRGNGGGELTDLDYLVGQMVTKQFTFGYTRAKNGIGRLDFTPWAPAVVKPWSGGSANITVPIVALADHLSASMSEIVTMAIKTLPNGKFIGTRTWGANGPLAPNAYFNDGQFTIGVPTFGTKGYLFTLTSSTIFKYINGDIYEGKGVPPDIYARETTDAFRNGDDLVIDETIRYIKTH
jgi:carboxyl-terminal processing protease